MKGCISDRTRVVKMSDIGNAWDAIGVFGLSLVLAGVIGGFIQALIWLHTEVATIPVMGWAILIGLVLMIVGILFGE